jgi:hypothetical protein
VPFKVSFKFDDDEYGWTETYYNTATSMAAAIVDANLLWSSRRLLLGSDIGAIGYTVSDESVQGDSIPTWTANVGYTPAMGNDKCFLPWMGVLLTFGGTALQAATLVQPNGVTLATTRAASYQVPHTIRGQSTTVVSGVLGSYAYATAWDDVYQRFAAKLVSPLNNWAFRKRDTTQAQQPILAVQPAGTLPARQFMQYTVKAHGFRQYDRVLLHNLGKSLKGFGGVRTILSIVDADNFTTYDTPPAVFPPFTPGGTIVNPDPPPANLNTGAWARLIPNAWLYVPITTVNRVRPTTRKTGGPPYQSKGKKKGRRGPQN